MRHANLLELFSLSALFSAYVKVGFYYILGGKSSNLMTTGAITPGFMIVTSMFYTRDEQTKRVGHWCELLVQCC